MLTLIAIINNDYINQNRSSNNTAMLELESIAVLLYRKKI